jgi:hypothetical protein
MSIRRRPTRRRRMARRRTSHRLKKVINEDLPFVLEIASLFWLFLRLQHKGGMIWDSIAEFTMYEMEGADIWSDCRAEPSADFQKSSSACIRCHLLSCFPGYRIVIQIAWWRACREHTLSDGLDPNQITRSLSVTRSIVNGCNFLPRAMVLHCGFTK